LSKEHHSAYDEVTTARCERALVTLLGDVGPWRERIYLAGGLAPRYLCGILPEGAPPHIGTTDIDLIVGVALGDDTPETYATLQKNLDRSGFRQVEPSYQWRRSVEGVAVVIEFLCETDQVSSGLIFRPKGEGTGNKLAAINIRGALLACDDFFEYEVEAERLDGGGMSRVAVRVANILPYTVLKVFAFQDRHENKDAYDLVFTLLNADGGDPEKSGHRAAQSPVLTHPDVVDALVLLAQRFGDSTQDGPSAYAQFLAQPNDEEGAARLRQEAAATVGAFLTGLQARS
jgi:hypothetical protein